MAHRDADEQNKSAAGEWSNRISQSGSLTPYAAIPVQASRGSNTHEP